MPETLKMVQLDERTVGPSRQTGSSYIVIEGDQQGSCRVKVSDEQLLDPNITITSGLETLGPDGWHELYTNTDQGGPLRHDKDGTPIEYLGGAGGNFENLSGQPVRTFCSSPNAELTLELQLWVE